MKHKTNHQAMMDRRSSTLASFFSALLLGGVLVLGGCSSGNIAGPQPDQPNETITQSDGGSTNDGGTTGSAGHNVSPED